MTNIYFYCDPITKIIITITKNQLTAEQKGDRVEIIKDSSDPIVLDPHKYIKYKLNDTNTDLILSGESTPQENIEECLSELQGVLIDLGYTETFEKVEDFIVMIDEVMENVTTLNELKDKTTLLLKAITMAMGAKYYGWSFNNDPLDQV